MPRGAPAHDGTLPVPSLPLIYTPPLSAIHSASSSPNIDNDGEYVSLPSPSCPRADVALQGSALSALSLLMTLLLPTLLDKRHISRLGNVLNPIDGQQARVQSPKTIFFSSVPSLVEGIGEEAPLPPLPSLSLLLCKTRATVGMNSSDLAPGVPTVQVSMFIGAGDLCLRFL